MKKIILKCLIGTLAISALLGIIIIVFELWDDTAFKVLMTTISLFCTSIPGLCISTIYESKYKVFSIIGLSVCGLSCLYFLGSTWINSFQYILDDWWWQIFLSLCVFTVFFAQTSLMLFIKNDHKVVKAAKISTIAVSGVFYLLILADIYTNFDDFINYKFIVVSLILATLCTIVTPILNKIYKKKDNA